jgi:hypothetical protein
MRSTRSLAVAGALPGSGLFVEGVAVGDHEACFAGSLPAICPTLPREALAALARAPPWDTVPSRLRTAWDSHCETRITGEVL